MSAIAASNILTTRVNRVRKAMEAHQLDALLVTNPENRRYLSGFTGHDSGADSAGALLVTREEVVLMTDGRYTEQANTECPTVRIVLRKSRLCFDSSDRHHRGGGSTTRF